MDLFKQVAKTVEEIKQKWPYEIDRALMKLKLLEAQDWAGIDKNFIVSTGRTGTRFFAKFLHQFSDVYAVHEPTPDFLRLAINYAQRKVAKEEAVEQMRYNRRALGKEVNRKEMGTYVESNNRLFALLSPLEEVFTEFKVIHIVRDGRDYVRSGMSRNWYTKEDTSPRMKATYFPDDPYYDQWSTMSRFEKICWRWQKKDGFIWDWVREAENAITVKFEDIFKTDDYRGVYQIADYIGLSKGETEKMIERMMNKEVNSTKNYAISHWTDWDEDKIKAFNRIAGAHMENYYSN